MDAAEYEAIAQVLVGRRIVRTEKQYRKNWDEEEVVGLIRYRLDNGRTLIADSMQGCSCGNGDWSVNGPETVSTEIITAVQAVEELEDPKYDTHGNGSALLRLFIYQDTIKTEIVQSQGQDNGYYGWGYYLTVMLSDEEIRTLIGEQVS